MKTLEIELKKSHFAKMLILLIAAVSLVTSAMAATDTNEPVVKVKSKEKPIKKPSGGVVSTFSDPIVYVPAPDCTGVYSDQCGWDGWGGAPYEGEYSPGGTVGGDGGGSYDDGTRGTANSFRRTVPGCYREEQFFGEIASVPINGAPVGRDMNLNINDPLYNDGNWTKYATYNASTQYSQNTKTTFAVEIHYMYNMVSHAVDQGRSQRPSATPSTVRCRHGENLQTSDYPGARRRHDHARGPVLRPIHC